MATYDAYRAKRRFLDYYASNKEKVQKTEKEFAEYLADMREIHKKVQNERARKKVEKE